ncbi:MAG: insulinase family protein [Sulfurovum sp.]|nr:insulinase family protein [Sulfurovum sp.]
MNILIQRLFSLLILPIMLLGQGIDDPYKNIEYFKLSNGLQVYMLSDKQVSNTQIILSVKVGMDIEDKANAGISHLLEHLIFRDERIPYHDYLDYIKEEGATYINGYTSQYETSYEATIDSNKSYWLVEIFAQMLLDKVVSDSDLEIEKKALQVEIGAFHWYHHLGYSLKSTLKYLAKIFPNKEDIYTNEFGLTQRKEYLDSYFYRKNNTDFSLEEVMHHYNTYYYPQNMLLKVVGNFEAKKMRLLIEKEFGTSQKQGTKTAKEPPYNATLNNKPHQSYKIGASKNYAYLGTKYILDDYKKYLILDAYSEYLATKMQQLLRNTLGQTYSVNDFYHSRANAVMTGVNFGSLHASLDENIQLVQKKIYADSLKIEDKEIAEALKQSSVYYSALEHDSATLLELISAQEYLQEYHQIFDSTPFAIFSSITKEEFQESISEAFTKQNAYSYIYSDYYFFPFDILILTLLMFFVVIVIYIRGGIIVSKQKGIPIYYTQRDVLLTRRIGNRFVLFWKFIVIFMIAVLLSEWSEYFLFMWIFDNPYYASSVDTPYSYVYSIGSFSYYLILFIVIVRVCCIKSLSRLDMLKEGMFFRGSTSVFIAKNKIDTLSVVPWSWNKVSHTYGIGIRFWKPLLKVTLHDARVLYIRSKDAQHLVEDLSKFL